jgi:hypothetical protein
VQVYEEKIHVDLYVYYQKFTNYSKSKLHVIDTLSTLSSIYWKRRWRMSKEEFRDSGFRLQEPKVTKKS